MKNQQLKRSIAHLGLLTFSKLIRSNHGTLMASSEGVSERQKVIVPTVPQSNYPIVNFGTNFTILLPIHVDRPYETHLPHPPPVTADTSMADIRGMETMFNYEVITVDEAETPDTQGPYLVSYLLPSLQLNNREDEHGLWKLVQRKMNLFLSGVSSETKYLFHVDLEKVAINGSQLFRFCGN